MLMFSERQKIADAFYKFLEQNDDVKICAESVIWYLCAKDLIDEQKAREFIDIVI